MGFMDRQQAGDLGGTAVFGDPHCQRGAERQTGCRADNLSYAYDEGTRLPNPDTGFPIVVDGNDRSTRRTFFTITKDEIIRAIADDKYPSPPARDLYLVSKGIPTKPAVVEFLKYILTEGQQHNVPIGYIAFRRISLTAGSDCWGWKPARECRRQKRQQSNL